MQMCIWRDVLFVPQRGWLLCGTTMPVAVGWGSASWRAGTAAVQCRAPWWSIWVRTGWPSIARTVLTASGRYRYSVIHRSASFAHKHTSTHVRLQTHYNVVQTVSDHCALRNALCCVVRCRRPEDVMWWRALSADSCSAGPASPGCHPIAPTTLRTVSALCTSRPSSLLPFWHVISG